MKRNETRKYIHSHPDVSVLIIGAGVNGIGVFRDLALQGIDTLIIDRGDFSSGTSAASSRNIHGGIRYLENGEFHLVRESVHERNWLLEHAPHAVKPQHTAIPLFHWFSGLMNAPLKFLNLLNTPSERGILVTEIGLQLYDKYTGKSRTVPRHKLYSRKQAFREFPDIHRDVIGVATYFDAQMVLAEHISVEMVLDAEEANPQAHGLNYCAPVGVENGQITLRDQLSGEELLVKPKIVVNAAGPWIDVVNHTLGKETTFIGGTKGSHILVDNPKLYKALNGYMMFFENEDGRFVMISRMGERVIIGSSDLYWDDPDSAICTPEEEKYFLDMVGNIFPDIEVKAEEIVFRFSGVRPLPTQKSKLTGQITRDHVIGEIEASAEQPYPILNLIGGKWTTFRALAEQTTDKILAILGQERKTSTADYRIGGGKDYPANAAVKQTWLQALCEETGIGLPILQKWFERYGTRTGLFAKFAVSQKGDRPLSSLPEYTVAEVRYLIRNEMVQHLDDFLLRRSILAMEGKVSTALVEELSHIFAAELDWDEDKRQTEIKYLADLLLKKHQYPLA